MKILVVEDDTMIREGLSEFLSESGYTMVQAKDGKAARPASSFESTIS